MRTAALQWPPGSDSTLSKAEAVCRHYQPFSLGSSHITSCLCGALGRGSHREGLRRHTEVLGPRQADWGQKRKLPHLPLLQKNSHFDKRRVHHFRKRPFTGMGPLSLLKLLHFICMHVCMYTRVSMAVRGPLVRVSSFPSPFN